MPSTTQTRRILIKVDAQGDQNLKAIADALGRMNKNTKDLADGFNFLKNSSTTFLGGIGIKTLTDFSDSIQNITNRLIAMGDSQEVATATLNRLVAVSRETNQSLDATSETYFRMSLALKDANISQDAMIALTKTISNTFRLSGASAQEAANATIQLGQAFSLGVLRGQDLRSVMSQNVTLTRLLRKEFGGDLLKQAEKGLITVPRIMEVLAKNMETVNAAAAKMGATFEQSLVKAIDAFRLKIAELSASIGASGLFAKAVDFLIKNMNEIITVMVLVAAGTIPSLISSVYALAASFGFLNPYVLLLVGGLYLLSKATNEAFTLDWVVTEIKIFLTWIDKLSNKVREFWNEMWASLIPIKAVADFYQKFANVAKEAAKADDDWIKKLREEYEQRKKLGLQREKDLKSLIDWAKEIEKAKSIGPAPDAEHQLAALNAEYLRGTITIENYYKKLRSVETLKATEKFKEGKEDVSKFNDQLRKVRSEELGDQFRKGAIGAQEYNKAIKDIELENLKEDLDAGKISITQFNEKLASVSGQFSVGGAFRTGLQDYLNSIGTTTKQVADAITHAFKGLEDVFVEFVKNGKFNFDKFTEAVLDDLTRIIIRASIIAPLANALLSGFSGLKGGNGTGTGSTGGSYGSVSNVAAHGLAFDHGVKKFAMGGAFVDKPTIFGYGKGGQIGMMGEAGPEAVLPLKRGSGGNLGVAATVTPVTIQIINQNGSQVKQSETTGPNGEKTIQILVTSAVREGIAAGMYDKVMKNTYGISRKGS